MILIGERINGRFRDVFRAVRERDEGVIHEWARRQEEAGAHYLEVNCGNELDDHADALLWLVKKVQEASSLPLCLDTADYAALEAALPHCEKSPIINSVPVEKEKIERAFPLAKKYGCKIVGITMDRKGIPLNAENRAALASDLISAAGWFGVRTEDLFIDPVVLPVMVAQEHITEVLDSIRYIKRLCYPPPKVMLGISNVSQGAPKRALINRTFLVMAMAAGLDAAICNVCDRELLNAISAARVLLNRGELAESRFSSLERDGAR